MDISSLDIIINPVAGQQEAVLAIIGTLLKDSQIKVQYHISTKELTAQMIVQELLLSPPDVIAVYGGDGTVCEVAQALYQHSIPIYILPGGTANVLARYFHIPLSTEEAFKLLINGKIEPKKIDIGLCNGQPFLTGMVTGLLAETVTATSREKKDSQGIMAYASTTIERMPESKVVRYKMQVDDKDIIAEGVSLLVSNIGLFGVLGVVLHDELIGDDGLFEITVVPEASWGSLINAGISKVFQGSLPESFPRWKGSNIKIEGMIDHDLLIDDVVKEFDSQLEIKNLKQQLSVLLPSS